MIERYFFLLHIHLKRLRVARVPSVEQVNLGARNPCQPG